MGFDSYVREIVPKLSNPLGLFDTSSLGQTIDWCINMFGICLNELSLANGPAHDIKRIWNITSLN